MKNEKNTKAEVKEKKEEFMIAVPKTLEEAEALHKEMAKIDKEMSEASDKLKAKKMPVIDKTAINKKDLFYIMSKIEWQGKEALGVIKINEIIQDSVVKDSSVPKDEIDYMKLTDTEANALYYLLLRVKSNSRHDAEIYAKEVFPIMVNLEANIAQFKETYDSEIKPFEEKLEKMDEALRLYEEAINIEQQKTPKDKPKKVKKENTQN